MAEKVKIGGRVTILTDRGPWDVDWIEIENRAWIADLYEQSLDGKRLRPLRIIAPRFAPGHTPPAGPAILEIFQKLPIPRSLLEQGAIPAELAPMVEVRESPDIWLENPASPHLQ